MLKQINLNLFFVLLSTVCFMACEKESPVQEEIQTLDEQSQDEIQALEQEEVFTINNDLVKFRGEIYSANDEFIKNLMDHESSTVVMSYPTELAEVSEGGVIPEIFPSVEDAEAFINSDNASRSCRRCSDMLIYDHEDFRGSLAIVHNIDLRHWYRTFNIPSWMRNRASSYNFKTDGRWWSDHNNRYIRVRLHEWPNGGGQWDFNYGGPFYSTRGSVSKSGLRPLVYYGVGNPNGFNDRASSFRVRQAATDF